MKILQVCKKFPYPLRDGEVIAIHNLTKGFHALGHQVTVLAINTKKHYFDIEQLPEELAQMAEYQEVFVDTSLSAFAAFKNLFSSKSYNIERFDNPDFRKKLSELLEANQYDLIHLEGVYLASYLDTIRKYSKAPIAMRAHNVEFEIWERLATVEKNPIKRIYLSLLAKRLRRFEIENLNRYDALVPITEKDGDYFKKLGCNLPCHAIQTGVDAERLIEDRSKIEYPSVFHIGGMDWRPNQEGLLWFFEQVWKPIVRKYPTVQFYMAGRNTPPEFYQLDVPNLTVLGEVDDAIEFMNSKAIMIVPLRSGSGMRIKIMEALALGKTTISTSIGAEGINAQHEHSILIANSATEFQACLEKSLQDYEFFEEIGKNARTFARENYDNLSLTAKLINFYDTL